jgi:hypothetical protein
LEEDVGSDVENTGAFGLFDGGFGGLGAEEELNVEEGAYGVCFSGGLFRGGGKDCLARLRARVARVVLILSKKGSAKMRGLLLLGLVFGGVGDRFGGVDSDRSNAFQRWLWWR